MSTVLNNRYVVVDGLNERDSADAVYAATGDERWAPANRCAECHHPEDDHLDETDVGWCTKPTGTCIFNSCGCKKFVRPACGTSTT